MASSSTTVVEGVGTTEAPLSQSSNDHIAELKARKLIALRRKAALSSIHYLNHEVFGLKPENGVWQAGDPRLRQCEDRINAVVQHWLRARAAARRKGQRAFSAPLKIMDLRPRECMKSSRMTSTLPAMAHLWEPDIATAIASATHEMATQYAGATAARWAGQDDKNSLVELFGTFKDPTGARKWREDAYVSYQRQSLSRRDPTLACFSVRKGAVGGHFDLLCVDDPEPDSLVREHGDKWHEKTYDFYRALYPCLQADGLLYIVMTRQGDGDLIARIVLNEMAPRIRKLTLPGKPVGELPHDWDENWMAYAHHAGWTVIYEHAWDGDIESDDSYSPRWPVIWPRARVLDWMGEYGLSFIMAQLQNRPAARVDAAIQPEIAERVWCDMGQVPVAAYNRMVITMDIAWKDAEGFLKERGDKSVIEVWACEDGHVYLVNGWDGRPTADEFMREWIRLWKWAEKTMKGRVIAHTLDKPTGGTGDLVRNTFKNAAAIENMRPPRILELNRAGTKKLDRIISAAGYWQSGLVHLVRGVQGSRELVDQMLKIGYSMHDDHADAAADIFHDDVYRAAQKATFGGLDPDTPRPTHNFHVVTFDDPDPRAGGGHSSRQAARRHENARTRVAQLLGR